MRFHLTVTPFRQEDAGQGGDVLLDRKLALTSELPNQLTQYVYLHSLEYLMYATEGWTFRITNRSKDGSTYDFERRYVSPYGAKTQLEIRVKENEFLDEINILMLAGKSVLERMRLTKDEDGKIIRREWTERNLTQVIVKRTYNEDGTCEEELYEIKERDVADYVPYLKVKYNYLSEAEFQKTLGNEQIIRVTDKQGLLE